MDRQAAQIWTICATIDHCFAFAMWCDDFAQYVNQEDMVMGLHRAFDVVSDATRLHSFVALRKLDEFLNSKKSKDDDLIAKDLGIDPVAVLRDVGATFLTPEERVSINKGAAHLTDKLTLDPDSEVDLHRILKRSLPVFSRLLSELRKVNNDNDNKHALDQTEALIKLAQEQDAKRTAAASAAIVDPGPD